jgi:hypothetical protein
VKPTIGRIVNYVDFDGKIYAAVVSDVRESMVVDLHVFRNDDERPVRVRRGIEFVQPFTHGLVTNTWHWPSRVETIPTSKDFT